MPNPYESLFDDKEEKKIPPIKKAEFTPMDFQDDRFPINQIEALDEILTNIQLFNKKGEIFSKLLSAANAANHQVSGWFAKMVFVTEDKYNQPGLAGERKYHKMLSSLFEEVVISMKDLAKIHVATVQQFNNEIDDNYFSAEKEAKQVKEEIQWAMENINLQRTVLANAAKDLNILEKALQATEKRIKKYVNAGGRNNISPAELAMISTKRTVLTTGRKHQFNHAYFKINLIDKTAINLGIYMKETSAQYIAGLMTVFD